MKIIRQFFNAFIFTMGTAVIVCVTVAAMAVLLAKMFAITFTSICICALVYHGLKATEQERKDYREWKATKAKGTTNAKP